MSPDVVVAGGGLAGAAAACRLARSGRRVVPLEREPLPHHKVCGEFVSVEAVRHLEALDADGTLAGLTPAPIGRVRLIAVGRGRRASCRSGPGGCRDCGSTPGCWMRPERAGAEVRCGVAVRSIAAAGGGVRVETADGTVAAGGAAGHGQARAAGPGGGRGHRRWSG